MNYKRYHNRKVDMIKYEKKFTCDLIHAYLFVGHSHCSYPGLVRYNCSWSFLYRDLKGSQALIDKRILRKRCLTHPGIELCTLLQNIRMLVTSRRNIVT